MFYEFVKSLFQDPAFDNKRSVTNGVRILLNSQIQFLANYPEISMQYGLESFKNDQFSSLLSALILTLQALRLADY